MSYPLLRARQSYLVAEIRQKEGFPSYEEMSIIYYGEVNEGDEWYGDEGDRLCVKYTNIPDSDLENQPAFCISSTIDINEGNPEILEF